MHSGTKAASQESTAKQIPGGGVDYHDEDALVALGGVGYLDVGDRHAGGDAPDPPKGTPTPPKPLSGEAKAEWDRMVGRLTQNGTISIVDDAEKVM